jgi:hypothetical protein
MLLLEGSISVASVDQLPLAALISVLMSKEKNKEGDR